jgi:hypothetical protein
VLAASRLIFFIQNDNSIGMIATMQKTQRMPKFYTVAQAAKMTGYSVPMVKKLCFDFKVQRHGRAYKITDDDIHKFMHRDGMLGPRKK